MPRFLNFFLFSKSSLICFSFFAGCAIALVENKHLEDFSRRTIVDYRSSTGNDPEVYVCNATNGAECLSH